ncbi:sigma-70 family RNA polymerase sigma factor [candidate division KSB1 bacterium]|nr:sigma-70 family RNA polymerase sigma factor [candidate division KSB1 bacterium]
MDTTTRTSRFSEEEKWLALTQTSSGYNQSRRKSRARSAKKSKHAEDKYLKEIGGEPLLSVEQEVILARQAKSGNQRALDQLTRANLRFVVSVARQYQHQGLALGDLINEGNLGLMKAVQRFDERLGYKFISYAVWWVRQAILQALTEQSRIVRLPLNRVGICNRVGRTLNTLEQTFAREPSPAEIANALDLSVLEVIDSLVQANRHVSLDAPYSPDEESRLLDIIESETTPAPDSTLMHESLRIEVAQALASLEPREAEVIQLYFGLDLEKPLTLEEIGAKFNLTRERVRQIKEKALRRLRHTSRSKMLRCFLG